MQERDVVTMKYSVIFLFAMLGICIAEEDLYTDRYDNFNIEEVLNNQRLFTSYMKCVLDKGRCTPEGKALKEHVRDAMQNTCARCTDAQKLKARKVVNYIREHHKDIWAELKKKYDPQDEYKASYEAFLDSEN